MKKNMIGESCTGKGDKVVEEVEFRGKIMRAQTEELSYEEIRFTKQDLYP